MIWPSYIMIRRLPYLMASFMLWVIIMVVRWFSSTILAERGQHLKCGLGVQCCRVLVQQQELRLIHGSHEQGQRLSLTAGKQAHTGGQPVLQAQVQRLEQLTVLFPLGLGDCRCAGCAACRAGQPAPGSLRSAWWRRCRSWGPGTRGRCRQRADARSGG